MVAVAFSLSHSWKREMSRIQRKRVEGSYLITLPERASELEIELEIYIRTYVPGAMYGFERRGHEGNSRTEAAAEWNIIVAWEEGRRGTIRFPSLSVWVGVFLTGRESERFCRRNFAKDFSMRCVYIVLGDGAESGRTASYEILKLLRV